MELKLRDGDYVRRGGRLEKAVGAEALLERVLYKLTARRGAFPFLPELGSRLHLLGQVNGGERHATAERYVAEALAGEAALTVEAVRLEGETLAVELIYEGEKLGLELRLGE